MKIRGMVLLFALVCGALASVHAASPLDKYPSLDKKQMGALCHIIELANRPRGSWELMEPEYRVSNDAFQFQIAFMYYALAVVQSQVTPAYRELYHQASRKLILKMIQPDVWGNWLSSIADAESQKYLDLSRDWRDPVREKNIMYSGHLLQMISLYETLYDDREFDAPASLVFEIPGDKGFIHKYDHKLLAKLIADQFVRSGYVGIECEPNRVFIECNEHAILGLIQFDRVHGTDLSDVRHRFRQKAEEIGYIDSETHRTMYYYKVKEKERLKTPVFAASDGWNGMMQDGWDREFVESVYPVQRDAELSGLIDTDPERWRLRWGKIGVSLDFGFLAAYAAEVGDRVTTQRLLDYADQHFAPQWANGGYFYPRHDVVSQEFRDPPTPVPVELLGQHEVSPLTGNSLLSFARLNPGHGIWNLYNPDSAVSYPPSGDPELVDVRYPEVQITQAYYDKDERRLAVKMVPGTDYQGRISFGIRNLSGQRRYVVAVDSTEKVLLDHGHIGALGPHKFGATWNATSQELEVDCILKSGRTVVVAEK